MSTLAHPGSGILVDRLGQIFFIDMGSGFWRMDTRGGLSHLSPLRNHWLAMDPNYRFKQANLPTNSGCNHHSVGPSLTNEAIGDDADSLFGMLLEEGLARGTDSPGDQFGMARKWAG